MRPRLLRRVTREPSLPAMSSISSTSSMSSMSSVSSRNSVPAPPATEDPGVLLAWCLEHVEVARPHYLWCVLLAALTARGLGVPEVSVLELGVAGGNGLVALEEAASLAERLIGVRTTAWGFDAGTGMPEPRDHRDVPWAVQPGYFAMDEAALRARLSDAQLVIGPVSETVTSWAAAGNPPVAFVACDLDYYSSTMDAFALFDAADASLLPRIPCYFDDVLGFGWSEHNGERAAIADFNAAHPRRKIGQVHGLRHFLPPSERDKPWPEQIWLAHLFDHHRYSDFALQLPTEFLDAHRLRPARHG